jgi:hypothetical protein
MAGLSEAAVAEVFAAQQQSRKTRQKLESSSNGEHDLWLRLLDLG